MTDLPIVIDMGEWGLALLALWLVYICLLWRTW